MSISRRELEARQATARRRPPVGDQPPDEETTAANVRAIFLRASMARFRRRLAQAVAPTKKKTV